MPKFGLAISTYAPQGCPDGVRQRLPNMLRQLGRARFPGHIVIVDDGSTDPQYCEVLDELSQAWTIFRRPQNGGISRTKNTCLRLLREANVDFGFLSDDDMRLRAGFHEAYFAAYRATGIQHFSWAHLRPSRAHLISVDDSRGLPVLRTEYLNGCLLAYTKVVLETVGGFKILPQPWGHEHSNWTRRIVAAGLAPFYADITNSGRFVEMSTDSDNPTLPPELQRQYAQANFLAAFEATPLFEPLTE